MLIPLLAFAQQLARSVEHELYRAQLAAAQSALRLSELAVARSWLDQTDPALRGFEWRVNDALLDESLASTPTGESTVDALAASSAGDLLACGLSNGHLELRSAQDQSLIAALGAHRERVTYVRFDRAGARLVSASYDRTVKLWDVATRTLLVEFAGHGYPIGGANFAPGGELVASCSYERTPERGVVGTVHLWNAHDGALVRTLEGGRKPLVGIEFSPDGRRLAAGSWDFCVFVWSVDGGPPLQCAVPEEGVYNAVDDVTWSADGRFVVAASKDHTARVWDSASGELVATLRGHTDSVSKLALAPDGAVLATASADGATRLWNTADWSLRATLNGHADDVRSVAFSADGAVLFTGASDRTLRTWDARTTRYGGDGFTTAAAPYVARYSPDDRWIAVASYDGRIEVRDALTFESVRAWQAHPSTQSCHALDWTPDGKQLVSGSWEPILRVWDAEQGSQLAELAQGARTLAADGSATWTGDGTSDLDVSPDGALVASAAGKKVYLWELATRTKRYEFSAHTASTLSVAFSPDSKLCVSTGRDRTARVWDAASGAPRFEIAGSAQDVADAQFTPNGERLVVATRDGHVTLHDAHDGRLLRSLVRLRHGIDHIQIAPDARRVAAASNVVALIDLEREGLVGELRPHREHPYNLDFDRAGLRLVSCSTDRTIAVSDTRPLRQRSSGARR
ncbi:MAG: hypothetical protein IT454_17145 [Planctomycetes bacterium]|nr:hypothetical protein [Planctomycetota bacterium]